MKKFVTLVIIILMLTVLNAANENAIIHCMGFIKTGNPLGIKEGDTIQLGDTNNRIVKYTTTGTDWFNLDGVHADTDEDKVWVDKFTALTPSIGSYDSSIKVSITDWGWEGFGNNKHCWFNIVCPNIDGIKSIQIRFGMYGEDLFLGDIYGDLYSSYIIIESDPVTLEDPASDYYRYLYESIALEIKLGTEVELITIPMITDWENVIVTYDKTDIKIYIDNVLIDTKTINDISGTYVDEGLFIGGLSNQGSFTNGIVGSLDEVAIFNKVLTAQERALIIKGGTIGTCGDARQISGLKAYWRFEEDNGSTVLDWAE